jgi:hypothetical protein
VCAADRVLALAEPNNKIIVPEIVSAIMLAISIFN